MWAHISSYVTKLLANQCNRITSQPVNQAIGILLF